MNIEIIPPHSKEVEQAIKNKPSLSPVPQTKELVWINPNPERNSSFYTFTVLAVYLNQVRTELGIKDDVLLTDEQKAYCIARRVVFDDAMLKGLPVLEDKLAKTPLEYPFIQEQKGKYIYTLKDDKITWQLVSASTSMLGQVNFQLMVNENHIPTAGETKLLDDPFLVKNALEIGFEIQKKELAELRTSAVKINSHLEQDPVFIKMSQAAGVLGKFEKFVTDYLILTRNAPNKHPLESEEDFKARIRLIERANRFYKLTSLITDIEQKSEQVITLIRTLRFTSDNMPLTQDNFPKMMNGLGLMILNHSTFAQPNLLGPGVTSGVKLAVVDGLKDFFTSAKNYNTFLPSEENSRVINGYTEKSSVSKGYRDLFKDLGIQPELGESVLRKAVIGVIQKVAWTNITKENIGEYLPSASNHRIESIGGYVEDKNRYLDPQKNIQPEKTTLTDEQIELFKKELLKDGKIRNFTSLNTTQARQLIDNILGQPEKVSQQDNQKISQEEVTSLVANPELIYKFFQFLELDYSKNKQSFSTGIRLPITTIEYFYNSLLNKVASNDPSVIEILKGRILSLEFNNATAKRQVSISSSIKQSNLANREISVSNLYSPNQLNSHLRLIARDVARRLVITRLNQPFVTETDYQAEIIQQTKLTWGNFLKNFPNYYELIKEATNLTENPIMSQADLTQVIKNNIESYQPIIQDLNQKIFIPDEATFLKYVLTDSLGFLQLKHKTSKINPVFIKPTGK